MSNYDFFQNKECEYFPCHEGIREEDFSCMFCYCPIYALGEKCGGNFSYDNDKGIKDCTGCLVPHRRKNYDYIVDRVKLVVEMTKKNPGDAE